MKALNHKNVVRSYARFAKYMVFLVGGTLFCIYFFLKTSEREIAEIRMRTGDSERIYNEQIAISDAFTDIFNTYRTLDISQGANPDYFMNSIASKKLTLGNLIERLSEKDALLHRHLFDKMDVLLRTRDSISTMKRIEDITKNDLIRCNDENRNVTRRLSVGRLSYNRK